MPIDWGVSQISPPMRILLVGAVVFLAAWFTVLQARRRPKSRRRRPPTTAPRTDRQPRRTAATKPRPRPRPRRRRRADAAPTRRDPGRGAGQAAQGRRPRAQGAQGARARRVRRRRQAVAPAGRRRPLRPQRPAQGQPLRRRASSSRTSPLAKLSELRLAVNDLGVNQSPSVVVIDRNLKGTVLTGYVDRIAINQAIADARADSIEPDITDAYLRRPTRSAALRARVTRWSRRRRSAARRPSVACGPLRQRSIASYRRSIARDAGAGQVARAQGALGAVTITRRERLDDAVKARSRTKPADAPSRRRRCFDSRRALRKLDRRFDDAGAHRCVDQPPVVDSGGRGPRAIRRAPRRAQWARRRAFRGLMTAHAGGALCGDLIRVSVVVEGDRVVAAGFDADGLRRADRRRAPRP